VSARRLLALAVIAVLALSGCAADRATFTDDDAQAVLFGQVTQASLTSLGLKAASNTIQTDSVKNYLAGVTDDDSGIVPAECANSARLLVLADQDKNSSDTFYALPNLTSGSTVIGVKARLFSSDSAAETFVGEFQKANEECPKFTAGSDQVEVTVSEAADASKGFRLDTVAGVNNQLLTIRTYIVREGNLAIAVQAQTNTDDDANLLVAASAAIYAQLTAGQ
jgi:hypothetical protein